MIAARKVKINSLSKKDTEYIALERKRYSYALRKAVSFLNKGWSGKDTTNKIKSLYKFVDIKARSVVSTAQAVISGYKEIVEGKKDRIGRAQKQLDELNKKKNPTEQQIRDKFKLNKKVLRLQRSLQNKMVFGTRVVSLTANSFIK